MHHYHNRAFYIGVLSVILIVVGLLALNFPVFIDAYDQWGWQIKCGTALMLRGIWAIPVVAIGSIVFAGVVLVAATVWGRESVFGEDQAA